MGFIRMQRLKTLTGFIRATISSPRSKSLSYSKGHGKLEVKQHRSSSSSSSCPCCCYHYHYHYLLPATSYVLLLLLPLLRQVQLSLRREATLEAGDHGPVVLGEIPECRGSGDRLIDKI